MTKLKYNRTVYLVDGNRTPFLKAKGAPGEFSATDLAVLAGRELFNRLPLKPADVEEVVLGCVMPSENEVNPGRAVGFRLGCGKETPGYTVQRNCASGMQALDSAFKDIQLGRHDLVLAGGAEAMSRAPLLFNEKMVRWFASWFGAKTLSQRLKLIPKLRPGHFSPVIALMGGLHDPLVGLSMGQTAENIAHRFNITREEMDEFAVDSHLKLAKALDRGNFKASMTPIFDKAGTVYDYDTGLRRDSTVERLAKLKPFFDKKFGAVTAANSSQITDGAAMMILASEEAVEKYKLPTLGKIIDIEWAGVEPAEMGLGPVHAVVSMLQRHKLGMQDIDFWELNEAFAAQVIGCVRAWASDDYCKTELGLEKAFGELPLDKLNIDGGAVAMGHPVGASGARIALQLANILKREKAKRGVATICIGGGQGGAVLIER